jgi:hypothetical protein
MNRRRFLRNTALAAAGTIGVPYILPTGRLFASTGSRKVNHVVFCLFAGGVRNIESVHQNDGNLMPNMLKGIKPITSDIAGSMTTLPPSPLLNPLQEYGTLFKEFRFDNGPTGHINGHVTAITGQDTNNTLDIRNRTESPTIFELYRKHSNPEKAALNSWWITTSNNYYPLLNHSQNAGYGSAYGANQLTPNSFFNYNLIKEIEEVWNSTGREAVVDDLNGFLNYNFFSGDNALSHVKNTKSDTEQVQAWLNTMISRVKQGDFSNPWQIPGGMNGDMRNVMYAEEVIKEFKPELLVVNMFGVDVAHTNFTSYCNTLQYADYATAHLWDTIQKTPGMKDDTILVVMPEVGRNGTPNSIVDSNGRFALDHSSNDPTTREIFCLIAGPQGVIKQDTEISTVTGRAVDVVPTIADALGFYGDVQGALPGAPLTQAYF